MMPVDSLLSQVVAASVRAAVLIILLATARRFFRTHVPQQTWSWAWLIVAAVLLIPVAWPVTWRPAFGPAGGISVSEFIPPADSSGGLQSGSFALTAPLTSMAVQDGSDPTVREGRSVRADASEFGWSAPKALWWIVWLGGAGLLVAARLFGVARFEFQLRRSFRCRDRRLERLVTECSAALRVRRAVDVQITDLVPAPTLCGLMGPRLLFPPGLTEQLTDVELRHVVRHELGHWRRRDLPVQALLQLAAAIHWFNPLVWWSLRLARFDCELACDEYVLERTEVAARPAYGRTLLKVLSAVRVGERVPAGLSMVEGKRQLVERIQLIAQFRHSTTRRALAGAALLVGAAVVGYTESASPPVAVHSSVSSDSAAATAEPKSGAVVPADSKQEAAIQPVANEGARKMEEANQARTEGVEGEIRTRGAKRQNVDWTTVVLRAVGRVGGVPVALVDVGGEPTLAVEATTRIGSYSVEEIQVAEGRIRLVGPASAVRILELTQPRAVKFPELSAEQVEALVAHVGTYPSSEMAVPAAILNSWATINHEGKESILLNYLKYGVVVGVRADPSGMGSSASYLFGRAKSQRIQVRRDAFLASLSAEQRAKFGDGRTRAYRIAASAEENQALTAELQEAKTAQDEIVANLSSEQRKLYDAWQADSPNPSASMQLRPIRNNAIGNSGNPAPLTALPSDRPGGSMAFQPLSTSSAGRLVLSRSSFSNQYVTPSPATVTAGHGPKPFSFHEPRLNPSIALEARASAANSALKDQAGTEIVSEGLAGSPLEGSLVHTAATTAPAARALSRVAVAVGPNEFPEGDSVAIMEVLSDSASLEVGSRVVVRGRYTLTTQAHARIGLSQTRTESRAPVPILAGAGVQISRGSGEFELVYEITQIGCMRVALNNVTPGPSFGTIYFGTSEQLASVKREVRGWVK